MTDITSGSGDLAIDHIQELRGYVMRGSPVLLSPQAAAYALNCIESNGLINTELEALRAENARLRAALAADGIEIPSYVGAYASAEEVREVAALLKVHPMTIYKREAGSADAIVTREAELALLSLPEKPVDPSKRSG